ncbi:MAG: spermidine/putrescine ABC transporter substrate-binding protein [Chloroflexi bacterium]|nr:spermidine/putrescine ABC transporter substrate-binding protein [Chloroflexota bacterium]
MRHHRAAGGRTIAIGLTAALAVTTAGSVALAQDPATSPDPALAGQSLVISNWAAYMPEDLPARFEAETGVPVTITNHATNEEVVAKLLAGNSGIDVAFMSGQFAQALTEGGFLAAIDHAQVPNIANLYPEANELAYDPGNTHSVPYAWGTTGLCYRTDLVDAPPTSWYDLLTPAEGVSGKTTALFTQRWLMLPAQKALGFSANTTDPAEMEQVRDLLLAMKPTLLAFDDTTFYSRLVSGEAALVEAWDGWCNYAIAEGADVGWVVPSEGSDLWVDTMTILESSPNKEAAHAFIDYILRPDVHSWVVENISYKVPNAPAMAAVDPAVLAAFPNLAMTPAELLQQESLVDLGEDGAALYQDIADQIAAQ